MALVFGGVLLVLGPVVTRSDAVVVGLVLMLLLGFNALLLHLVSLKYRSRAATAWTAVLIAACGMTTVLSPSQLSGGPAILAIGSAAIAIGAGLVFCKRLRHLGYFGGVIAAAPVALAFCVAFGLSPAAKELRALVTPAAAASPRPAQDDMPVFEDRPDVYLLGFLSAVPDRIAADHLGLPTTGLHEVFEQHGIQRIPNVFSEAAPTRPSYDALLSLGAANTRDIQSGDRSGALFAGHAPSLVFDIFRANGYSITAITHDSKFGTAAGGQIDRLVLAHPVSLCADPILPDAVRAQIFFGACRMRSNWLYDLFAPGLNAQITTYLDGIAEAQAHGSPNLVIGHMRPPIHYSGAPHDGPDPSRVAEFADRYEEAVADAAALMDALVSAILAQDPEAVMFIFGDHGLSLAEVPRDADAPSFAFRDAFAVLAGVRFPGECPTIDANALGQHDASTTAYILRTILTCLAAGRDPLPEGHPHGLSTAGGLVNPSLYTYE